jgi:hypothetical protein
MLYSPVISFSIGIIRSVDADIVETFDQLLLSVSATNGKHENNKTAHHMLPQYLHFRTDDNDARLRISAWKEFWSRHVMNV